MNEFFDSIVLLFETICKVTGLRYAELNILVYCLVIPFTWALLAYFRNRKLWVLPLLHFLTISVYLLTKRQFVHQSLYLYDKNIRALENLAKHQEQGYIYLSLLLGVAIPITLYGLLGFVPKKWIVWVYLFFILALGIYEIWVLYHS